MEREINLTNKFIVGFWGKFIPLQGVPYIVKAAKILENEPDISFEIIGRGQTYAESASLAEELKLNNTKFSGLVSFKDLPLYLKRFDVCLGIFGNTFKTKRVIPNKIYEAIALARPVITANTPAINELFTNEENVLLCRVADPEDLAAKILILKNNPELKNKIARGGYQLYLNHCRPQVIGKKLLADLGIN